MLIITRTVRHLAMTRFGNGRCNAFRALWLASKVSIIYLSIPCLCVQMSCGPTLWPDTWPSMISMFRADIYLCHVTATWRHSRQLVHINHKQQQQQQQYCATHTQRTTCYRRRARWRQLANTVERRAHADDPLQSLKLIQLKLQSFNYCTLIYPQNIL